MKRKPTLRERGIAPQRNLVAYEHLTSGVRAITVPNKKRQASRLACRRAKDD